MKLLVAVDHSEASQAVVKEVAARPWPSKSCVEVLNVVEPAHSWIDSKTAEESVQMSAKLVEEATAQLRSQGLEATGLSVQGDAKRMILDRAEETHPDFVFVGSQCVSALSRFLLGNVASAVVRHAPCSVEIVRARKGTPRSVRKILLATDGSEYGARAAQSIAERPWEQGAQGTEIIVLSVVELALGNAQAFFEPPYVDSEHLEMQRAEAMKRAQTAVSGAVEILSKTFPKVTESISVLLGGPKSVILEEAEKTRADLIVVGSHGHRGIERFMLGSVSEGVALQAHCSVEVIR